MGSPEADVSTNIHKSNEFEQAIERKDEDSEEIISGTKSKKEEIIEKMIAFVNVRHQLIKKNNSLQHKLALLISRSFEKDFFLKMNLEEADERSYKKLLDHIYAKENETENFTSNSLAEKKILVEEITGKQDSLIELKNSFKETTEKAALKSVNSETGERFSINDVKELLNTEEEVAKSVQEYQLYSIQKRYSLNLAINKKKNLAEGPLSFAEYEMMCIETQNNKEIIQPISEEIKNIMKKSSNIINIQSHLGQKLYLAQKEKNKALNAEEKLEAELNEMRDMLFEEKMKYTKMKQEIKELEHKFILLQHPRLIEDYNQIKEKNEEAYKELQRLKKTYEEEIQLLNEL